MNKSKCRRRSFTLIEIILCISILAMIGGLLTYKGKDLILKAQTNSEISKLKKTLDLARSLALSYHADIDVIFNLENQKLTITLSSEEQAVKEALEAYKCLSYSHIESIFFENEEQADITFLHLMFSSTGWMFPNKNLIINSKEIFIST